MSAGKSILLIVVVLLIGGVLAGGCAYSGYKHTIALDEQVKKASGNIETALQRRFDLIPNIMRTVQGYASHEKELLTDIANVRKSYAGANTMAEKAKASNQLDSVLSRFLVISERYPDLKASQNFRDLQVSLEGTENRIKEERQEYNEQANHLNTYIRAFPGSLYARWAGVENAEYFKAGEGAKEAPKVEF